VPLIYRIAIRELRQLGDLDENVVVTDRINTWREATRHSLARAGRGLPPSLADAVVDGLAFMTTTLVTNEVSDDGGTSKLLLETHDGHRVEAVVIRRHGRSTSICVSSQVGCQMGCQFCATGTMGIIGDLTAAEILEQAVYSYLAPSSLRCLPVRNIVFMGMGEPLNNFQNVRAAVEGFTDFSRFGLGRPHVTVSTVGVVPYMESLTRHLPGVALALSLHAPNQVCIPCPTHYVSPV
jgi:adenine C2-methylase RlmN of 23S rRNA A2503 and tRNA A37